MLAVSLSYHFGYFSLTLTLFQPRAVYVYYTTTQIQYVYIKWKGIHQRALSQLYERLFKWLISHLEAELLTFKDIHSHYPKPTQCKDCHMSNKGTL